jgi:hypothetical protein
MRNTQSRGGEIAAVIGKSLVTNSPVRAYVARTRPEFAHGFERDCGRRCSPGRSTRADLAAHASLSFTREAA